MLGKTHLSLGIASALAVTQPTTVPAIISSVIGGGIGGLVADIDNKQKGIDREKIYDSIINTLFIGFFVILDYIFGEGICQYISFNWGPKIWISLLGLIALLLFGNRTSHRAFTHSFFGITSISLMIYILCKPFAICFVLGYASHLLADFFNKLGLQLFYPLKWRFCLKVCASDKKGNRILFWITLTINIILSAILFSNAITSDLTANNLFQFVKNPKFLGLNLFQIYLIVINIITFCSMQANFNYFINNLFHRCIFLHTG